MDSEWPPKEWLDAMQKEYEAAMAKSPFFRDFTTPYKIISIDDIKTSVEDTKVGETCWDDCLRRNVRGKVNPGQMLRVAMPNPLDIHHFDRVVPLELGEWPSFAKVATFEAEIWELRHQTKVIVWRRIK